MQWQAGRFSLSLHRPYVMGIVNTTPDSFSDGGRFAMRDAAIRHCELLLEQGADMLDIGGESTRPGAQPVPLDEELRRVVPVVQAAVRLGVPVSVDTYKPAVMQAVLDAGADIINDVWALRHSDGSGLQGPQVVAGHARCGVCLMHMHREPQTMQAAPMQGDVVPQVLSFLQQSSQSLYALGVNKARIAVDVGIGFGKTVEQNFALLAHQRAAVPQGLAVLAGWSRKSSLAAVTQAAAQVDIEERLVPSVVAAVLAVERGAHIVRVHDVRQTVQALQVWQAMHSAMNKATAP
ncbi:dihydropteroate synthase [Curvibacter sp. CHRR-16]|uniref:dihydropteroate synthase n=1 Tax=Curvibacter sp. CHRR-16 TaxID=2835872 RepID=UPI001BD9E2F8|nr:dihydropteroate synthase [Curvibacter sp. CHRR-16]MBT0570841.1 dihydropteroate synthase [Curvibacter sp. CHRR-16]